MHQDARIEVDHVGVGVDTKQASGLYQDSAILDNEWGQLASRVRRCCFHLCICHTDEHYSVVQNRLLDSKLRCLCCEGGKIDECAAGSFLPRSNGGGWARLPFVCTQATMCRVEVGQFLTTYRVFLLLPSRPCRPLSSNLIFDSTFVYKTGLLNFQHNHVQASEHCASLAGYADCVSCAMHASETQRQLEGFRGPIRRAQKQDAIYLVYLGTTDRSFRRSAGFYQQTLRH